MSAGHRCEIAVSAGPAREGILDGRAILLVRVRVFDSDCVEDRRLDACDLRPEQARALALALLDGADNADWQTDQAGHWSLER
jgi:hypothetical protein